jgi:biotin synthase
MTDIVALDTKHDWSRDDIALLFDLPLAKLVMGAQAALNAHFPGGKVQKSQLLSIKTGGCPETCGYCSQSASFDTGLKASKLMGLDEVISAAQRAKDNGADRFCMGAAWRGVKDRDLPQLTAMVTAVKNLGLETCMTLGMLEAPQAAALSVAGLDYYNHNLDTGPEDYARIVDSRTYDDRLRTLSFARKAGMKLCCGGIVGMGEEAKDRIGLIQALANLNPHPESVPINRLVPIPGTPLGNSAPIPPLDFVKVIAVARLTMPTSYIRLSAGRESMSEEMQALCLLAGANSIFIGDKLLTTPNSQLQQDQALLAAVG